MGLGAFARDEDDRQLLSEAVAELLVQLEAARSGQDDVYQREGRRLGHGDGERRVRVPGHDDREAGPLEHRSDHLPELLVVPDDQHRLPRRRHTYVS